MFTQRDAWADTSATPLSTFFIYQFVLSYNDLLLILLLDYDQQ